MQDSIGDDFANLLLEPNADAWLAAIVESSEDAIIGKTLDSIVRSWNVGAAAMFGYEAAEIIGKSVYILIPQELHAEEPEIIARLTRGERMDHFETVRLRADGTRIEVSISVSPIRDKSGSIVGAAKIARDITEAKRLQRVERELSEQLQEFATELEAQIEEGQTLQEEIEQTNEELILSLTAAETARRQAEEANATKSQFLATMSHELRTPLNAIAGYVDILELGIRGPITEEQRHDLGRIKQSEQTLRRLIDDVLNFARLESGRMEYRFAEVRVDDILARLESFVAPRLKQKQLDYRFEPCGEDLVRWLDQEKVEQIMLNLLSNAVKFTDAGHVIVRCAVEETELRIEVHDTGRGVRADLLDKIFEPFVQGDHSLTRTADGTGLGLSISRELARGMGGDIAVQTVEGQGSVFALVLPTQRQSRRTPR